MRRPLLILAAIVALALPACGDDVDSADEAASELEQRAGEAASEASDAASELASEAEEAASEAEGAASEAASELEEATEAAGQEVDEAQLSEQADRLAEELRARGATNVASLIEAVGLQNVVQDQTFTLLAPNDDAFLALDREVLTRVLADPGEAVRILQDHLADERLDRAQLEAAGHVETAAGSHLPVVVDGDQLTIGGAIVTEADVDAGDGVIHIIDRVIDSGS